MADEVEVPTPEPQEATQESQDASRAAFDAAMRKASTGAAPKTIPMGGTPEKVEPAPETPEEAPAAEAEPSPETGQRVTKNSKDYRKSREQLLLHGIKPKALDALSAEETIEQWSGLSKQESDAKAAFRERAELQKRLEELEAKATTQEETSSAVPTSDVDLGQSLKPLFDEIGLEPDSDAAKALQAAMEASNKPTRDALEKLTAENKQLRESFQSEQTAKLEDFVSQQRERLGDRVPRLKESDDAWMAVLLAADSACERDSGLSREAALDAAVLGIYGEQNGQAEAPKSTVPAPGEDGQPTPPKRPKSPDKPLSPKEADRAVFDAIMANRDDAGPSRILKAQRAAGLS